MAVTWHEPSLYLKNKTTKPIYTCLKNILEKKSIFKGIRTKTASTVFVMIVAGREIPFLQQGATESTAKQAMPWKSCQHRTDSGEGRVFLCVLFVLECFLRKKYEVGWGGREIWEELVRGKNMTKI